MNVHKLVALSACGASLGFASFARAQQVQVKTQPVQVQVQGPVGQPAQRAHGQTTDQKLATCLAIANQEEVAIAKFADEKSHNREVKDFAQMLVKDHEAFLKRLQRFAPEAAQEGYLDRQQAGNEAQQTSEIQKSNEQQQPNEQQRANNAQQQQRAREGVIQQTAATQEGESHLDFVHLHREIAQECIRSAKQELGKKDSEEFDRCFVGHQIAKHEEMKTKLIVFERHVSSDLKQIIADGIETTTNHLKKAEKLMKKLDGSDTKNDQKQTQR